MMRGKVVSLPADEDSKPHGRVAEDMACTVSRKTIEVVYQRNIRCEFSLNIMYLKVVNSLTLRLAASESDEVCCVASNDSKSSGS